MTSEEEAFFNGFHQGMAKGRLEEGEKRAELIRQDVLLEREACASLCEKLWAFGGGDHGLRFATAIRNREPER
jgi:hypothetical protein